MAESRPSTPFDLFVGQEQGPTQVEHAVWFDQIHEGQTIRWPWGAIVPPVRVLRRREDGGIVSVIGIDDEGNEHVYSGYGWLGVFLVEPIPDTAPEL
jgi:hypothetical protein